MKTFRLVNGLLVAIFLIFSISCDDDDDDDDGAILRTNIEGNALLFSVDATEIHVVKVTTNQGEWKVKEDPEETWCKITDVTKEQFTVTATKNPLMEKRTAIITVSAGVAKDLKITVTQNEATEEPGEEVDNKKNIWEDTHWRWFKLNEKIHTVNFVEQDYSYQFNASGKLLKYTDGNDVEEYEYDDKERISKITFSYYSPSPRGMVNKANKGKSLFIRSVRTDNDKEIMEIEYGDHTKYFPLTELGDEEETYLVRGITAVILKEGDKTEKINFEIKDSKILFSSESEDESIKGELTYSGDYPVSATITNSETVDGDTDTVTAYYEYAYGINNKYKQIKYTIKDTDYPEDNYINTYQLENTLYHLLIEETMGSETVTCEYDNKGRVIKETEKRGENEDVTIYTYEEDGKGNWIKRTALSGDLLNREITYFD